MKAASFPKCLSVYLGQKDKKLKELSTKAYFIEAMASGFIFTLERYNTPVKGKDAVFYLMLYKKALLKRITEASSDKNTYNDPTIFDAVATDLRGYYRSLDIPEDVAQAFADFLHALDKLALVASKKPRNLNGNEALAVVFLFALAKRNPLEPAFLDQQNKSAWAQELQQAANEAGEAEQKLSKVCIKYGIKE